MTRILQGFAFLYKLGLLLFKPHWGYQIYMYMKGKNEKNSGRSSKMTPSCKCPFELFFISFLFTLFSLALNFSYKYFPILWNYVMKLPVFIETVN